MLVAHPIALMPSVEEESTNLKASLTITRKSSTSSDVWLKHTSRRVSSLSIALSDATTVSDPRRSSHDLSGFEPHLDDLCIPHSNQTKYSIALLLKLRHNATPMTIDLEYGDAPKKQTHPPPAVDGKIIFRAPKDGKPVPRNVISFHEDMEVGEDCLVNVHNLDCNTGWPHLNTFCTKTVGIKPLNIRMMRRLQPCRAMLVFSSPEEAKQFVDAVPEKAVLKGRKLRFSLNAVATAEISKTKAEEDVSEKKDEVCDMDFSWIQLLRVELEPER